MEQGGGGDVVLCARSGRQGSGDISIWSETWPERPCGRSTARWTVSPLRAPPKSKQRLRNLVPRGPCQTLDHDNLLLQLPPQRTSLQYRNGTLAVLITLASNNRLFKYLNLEPILKLSSAHIRDLWNLYYWNDDISQCTLWIVALEIFLLLM